jgi:hypothetical protein
MDKKKRDKVKPVAKKGPAEGEAQEDLELANEQAQRVKGGAAISIPKQIDKSSPILS